MASFFHTGCLFLEASFLIQADHFELNQSIQVKRYGRLFRLWVVSCEFYVLCAVCCVLWWIGLKSGNITCVGRCVLICVVTGSFIYTGQGSGHVWRAKFRWCRLFYCIVTVCHGIVYSAVYCILYLVSCICIPSTRPWYKCHIARR